MNILNQIVGQKSKEVEKRKQLYPKELLTQSIYFNTPVVSLSKYLKREDRFGVIAEFKRKSPSAGIINNDASVEKTSIGYMQSGASALSILTDNEFFGGKSSDLTEARKYNFCPILRKDFIIDEYQIVEARSIGADAILLIAACLEKKRALELAKQAKDLGLEVLLEVHEESELEKVNEYVDVVGVNNRNLKTFDTDIQMSRNLFAKIPSDFVKISESGINNPKDLAELKQIGFDGFLIGGHFMKHYDPAQTCRALIRNAWSAYHSLVKA